MMDSAPTYTKWEAPADEPEEEEEEEALASPSSLTVTSGPNADLTVRRRRPSSSQEDLEEELEEEEEKDAAAVTAALAKRWEVPISHEIELKGHSKTVACVAVDASGTRVLTGSMDYKVRMYDFGGMDKHHNSFREIEPDEGHPIIALSYAPGGGDRFLCCTGSAQPQIFTREGAPLLKFNRGDPYVTDMARTNGHVTMVTGGEWHPHEKMQVATSGRDGSVRIWDLCGKTGLRDYLLCDQTIRVRDAQAKKCAATCVAYSPDGRVVACGSADGAVQMWQVKGRSHNYLRPDACARQAHLPGTDASGSVISSVKFSPDGLTIASRADDGFVKLWDARKLKGPLASFGGVPCHHATANLAWRPDGAIVCAGTAPDLAADKDAAGAVRFFSAAGEQHEIHQDAGGYAPLVSLGVAKKTAVVTVLWHPRIRHIFCGTSAGVTRVLYDPDLSARGALLTVRRNHAKRVIGADAYHVDASKIINPNALPMYRDNSAFAKRKGHYSKMRNDPKLSKKPAPPMESGQQGRNTGGRSTFSSHFIDSNLPASIRQDDPREELLKFADKKPIFRTEATFYEDKDGKRLMDTETLEAAQTDFIDKQKKLLDKTGSGRKPH